MDDEAGVQTYITLMRNRAGERLDVVVTNVPMYSGGQVVGAFGIVQDAGRRLVHLDRGAIALVFVGLFLYNTLGL